MHEPTVKLPIPRPNNVDTTAVLALHADLTNDDTAAREFAFFNPESTLNTPHVMIADGAEEPQQIAAMGKAIAPDDELFADGVDKKAVA
jgi:hypothetical protein